MIKRRKNVQENRSRLAFLIESELEKAELVLAVKSVTDKLQTMAENLVKIEADDIMPMLDSLKTSFGPQIAEKFNQVMTEQLRQLVENIRKSMDIIGNEVIRLENAVNGESTNDMNTPLPDMDTDSGEDQDFGADDMPTSDDTSDMGSDGSQDDSSQDDSSQADSGKMLSSGKKSNNDEVDADLPPLDDNSKESGFAGRAKKEGIQRNNNKKIYEYRGANFDASLNDLSAFDSRAGILGFEIQDMIDEAKFNGKERKSLEDLLAHLAGVATDHHHWEDPDAKVEAALRASRMDTRIPEVNKIVTKLKKLAHLISFKHDGMVESRKTNTLKQNIAALREAKNPDALVLQEFKKIFAKVKDTSTSVDFVAEKYSIDKTDVVSIIKESFRATEPKKKELKTSHNDVVSDINALQSKIRNLKSKSLEVPAELEQELKNLYHAHHEHMGEKVRKEISSASMRESLDNWRKLLDYDMRNVPEKTRNSNARLSEAQPMKPKTPADLRADQENMMAAKNAAKNTAKTAVQPPTGGSTKQPPAQLAPGQKPPAAVNNAPVPSGQRPAPQNNTLTPAKDAVGQTKQNTQSIPVGQSKSSVNNNLAMPGKIVREVSKIPPVTLMSKPTPFPKPGQPLMNTSPSISEAKKKADPCWDDYKMIGMKKKNGKKVPNCVPKKAK